MTQNFHQEGQRSVSRKLRHYRSHRKFTFAQEHNRKAAYPHP